MEDRKTLNDKVPSLLQKKNSHNKLLAFSIHLFGRKKAFLFPL